MKTSAASVCMVIPIPCMRTSIKGTAARVEVCNVAVHWTEVDEGHIENSEELPE